MITLYLLENKYHDGHDIQDLFAGKKDFVNLDPNRNWGYFPSKEKAIENFSSDYDVFCVSEFIVSDDQMLKLLTTPRWHFPTVEVSITTRWYYEFNSETGKFDFIKSKQFL